MFFTHKIESFFRSFKLEEVYMFSYETYEEVRERIPYFIDEVYNRKRLHSFVCKFQLFLKVGSCSKGNYKYSKKVNPHQEKFFLSAIFNWVAKTLKYKALEYL